MTRRVWALMAVLLLVVAAGTATLVASRRGQATRIPSPVPASEGLALLILNGEPGPIAAVVGGTGSDRGGAVVVPPQLDTTIPGQGDGTIAEALTFPPRQAATATANLLGVWIDHYAVIGRLRLAAIVDRVGGIEVGGETRSGAEVVALMDEPGVGRPVMLQAVLGGLLTSPVRWEPTDFFQTDSASSVTEALDAASGALPKVLPVDEVATGVFQSSPQQIRETLMSAFGGPDREVVGVIVLNGSGVPGVGELVAEKIVPGGFRIVVNENASSFDHEETLVVVGSANDVALGQRVRDLLGVGSVSVSVSSGLAPVTVLVGKDLGG